MGVINRLLGKNSAHQEIKDVFYLLALQGLNYIAPLLVLPYLMKVLGAEKFGYIGFSLSVMQYLMLIVDFGFNFSATKRVALAKDNKGELNKIFASTFYAKIGLFLLCLLILIVVASISHFAIYRVTMFIMFLMVVGNTFTYTWLFQGLGKIRLISIFNMISKLLILPLTFIFVRESGDYLIAAFIQSFIFVFVMIMSLTYLKYHKLVSFTNIVKSDVICEIKESFPIFLSGAATTLYTASFVIILGYFANAEQVGQYSAVDRITRALCYLIFVPVSQAFYPKIAQLGVDNRQKAIKILKNIFIFVCVCMLIIFALIYISSPYIVSFLGKDYSNSLSLFRIMSIVPLFVGVGGISAQLGILAIGNNNDKKRYQQIYSIAGVIAIVSVFSLVPFFKAQGASIALLITEFFVCVMMLYFLRHLIRRPI